jgi:hypothetical protein
VDFHTASVGSHTLLVFGGSGWEGPLVDTAAATKTAVVAIGATLPRARIEVRYPHDGSECIRLLAEPTVPELIAVRAMTTN